MTLDVAHDVTLADAVAVVCEAWALGWTIPPRLTVSQWADANRKIAKGAGAEPGDWYTSRNPILREIMDALSDHSPVREVDFKKSAQIGATEIGINWCGYVIDRGIDSMIVAQPVKDLSRAWATTKFDPAVELMPALATRLHSDNTLEKRYPGGTLWIIWTNSSNQLRQRTARFIFMDEVDEYPDNLGDQGGADEQLAARALSYGDRAKIYRACTPTVAGGSKIDAGWLAGDQRRYMVPCPECGAHQVLDIEHLQPDGVFSCAVNGCLIREHHKTRMLRERSACSGCGEVPVRVIHGMRGTAPIFADTCSCGTVVDPPSPDGAYWQPHNAKAGASHRSYHAWAAYTPEGLGKSWRDIATARSNAQANPDKLAAFTNLIVGEVFEGERTTQDAEELKALAEPGTQLGIVPDGALILTAGVDCQHDRFEVQIVGWGRGQRGRVVEYAVIDGDPSSPDGFSKLDDYLKGTWPNAHDKHLHLTAVAIDGGNWTEMVAQYVKRCVAQSGQHRLVGVGQGYRRQHVYLVRGRSEANSDRAVYKPRKTETDARDKTIARSVGVWGVGTSVIKHLINGWLSAALVARSESEKSGEPDPIESRILRFPGGRGEPWDPIKPDTGALPPSYFEGLASEYYDHHAKKWIHDKRIRNEPLDTAVYAYWAALSPAVKIDTIRENQWAALELMLQPDPQDLFTAPPSKQVPAQPGAAKPAGGLGSDAWSGRL